MDAFIADFIQLIEHSAAGLQALSDAESARRPAPGKWSPREIIGHLIDSASNNHQRFVRAQFQDNLLFPGYDQDAWVAAQRYQDVPWSTLITLWQAYNIHLAHVMAAVPESIRTRPHRHHNFHQIAMRPVPEDAPTTLEYLMRDYVFHLRHHVRQILPPPDTATAEASA